ncbi:MAG TPA: hypothetical protein VKZ18_00180 [Polyangia bacterium]|nr:hypothetical protein [Polyangia bacterium]
MPASPRPAVNAPLWLKRNLVVAGVVRRSLQLRTQSVKRFIFTATTGRSGTLTLSELFANVPECAAVHEPYPIMNEEVLRAASYGNEAEVDRVYSRIKSINILRTAAGHRYYLEANHLLVKTFLGQAYQEFGRRMAVIHLVRGAIEVAMSIYCLQHLPGTPYGNAWWLDYRAPTNIIQIADELEGTGELSHTFYRGLWYWYELELRFAAWRARLPALEVVRFETSWFNDAQKTFRLLDELEIAYDRDKVSTFVGRKEHTKFAQKTMPVIPRGQAEKMDETFRRALQARGIDLAPIGRSGP